MLLMAGWVDVSQSAEEGNSPLMGSVELPFPAFLPLDYNAARAEAWLDALGEARKMLPPSALARLWDLDCDVEICGLALAALIFPVEAATPDISSSRDIKVFLGEGRDLQAECNRILDSPELFLTQMALLVELRLALEEWRNLRPESVAKAGELVSELDPLAVTLDQIWHASRKLCAGVDPKLALEAGSGSLVQSIPFFLGACRARLGEGESQSALALSEKAVAMLEQIDAYGSPAALVKYLQGSAMHLRGLAHWRQDQLALAETDLIKAEMLLDETALPFAERAQISLDLGGLRKDRRDPEGMCQSFRKACLLGQCAQLAELRRNGQCLEMEAASP